MNQKPKITNVNIVSLKVVRIQKGVYDKRQAKKVHKRNQEAGQSSLVVMLLLMVMLWLALYLVITLAMSDNPTIQAVITWLHTVLG